MDRFGAFTEWTDQGGLFILELSWSSMCSDEGIECVSFNYANTASRMELVTYNTLFLEATEGAP